MGKTNISWTDFSFNGWEGCAKVSPGCAHCYAETLNHRWGKDNWGKGKPRRRTSESNWKQPLKWNKSAFGTCPACAKEYQLSVKGVSGIGNYVCGLCNYQQLTIRRPRVFCASMSDWLDDEVPIEWLADLLKLIHETPNLDWQLLTKRPENWAHRIAAIITLRRGGHATLDDLVLGKGEPHLKMLRAWYHGTPPHNVWIGTSAENQEMADKRIPELLKIPAKIKFLSCEPLLGKIDFSEVPEFNKAGSAGQEMVRNLWVIAGGESGPKRREMNLDWLRSLHNQCRNAGVAWFCKQDSGPKPGMRGRIPDELWTQEFPNI